MNRQTDSTRSFTALIVDDEDPVRRFVERVLREAGYTTAAAAGGTEALKIAAELGSFDILVTDMMMPEMTGDELARRLRSAGAAAEGPVPDGVQRTPVQGKDDALAGRGLSREAVFSARTARSGVAAADGTLRRARAPELRSVAARPRAFALRMARAPRLYPPRVCISRWGSRFSRSCTGTKARRSPSASRSSAPRSARPFQPSAMSARSWSGEAPRRSGPRRSRPRVA